MIHLIVGHRGVGKTSFVKRIEQYYLSLDKEVLCLDLDAEVEKFQSMSVTEIFQTMGEEVFREMEQDVLNNLIELYGEEQKEVYISLGAGFEGEFPRDMHVIWLQRPTDGDGRVFLDRPRLDLSDTSYGEYIKRYQKRRVKYMTSCHEEYSLEEGFDRPNLSEKLFLGLEEGEIGGILTLLPENFFNKKRWKSFIKKRLKWGVQLFEVRDDYLSEQMIQLALATIPHDRLLLSFREPKADFFKNLDLSHFKWDWPLELGELGDRNPSILSLHERFMDGSVSESARYLEDQAGGKDIYLKLAVQVDNFLELKEGHDWWLKDPSNRCFLPRSEGGRWAWYRMLQKGNYPINFFREALGSSMDQPSLFEWTRFNEGFESFAAIFGDPVHHSLTPSFHEEFFASQDMNILRIEMREDECGKESLNFLKSLGLRAAAITSPVKKKFYQVLGESNCVDVEDSINTIVIDSGGECTGYNTDPEGFEHLVKSRLGEVEPRDVAIWGGGGTKSSIIKHLNGASQFSARTGQLNIGEPTEGFSPEVLVWAVGRSRMGECLWPPTVWSPRMIIDLNYSSDSPGKEYAEQLGAEYVSGLDMFEGQGLAQQKIWKEKLS